MSEDIDRWILSKDGDYSEMEFSEHGPYVLHQDYLADTQDLKLEIEADNRNAVDFINRIAELDREIVKLKENAKLLVRDLDECQRAWDKAAGIGLPRIPQRFHSWPGYRCRIAWTIACCQKVRLSLA